MNQIFTSEHQSAITAYVTEGSRYVGAFVAEAVDGQGLQVDGTVDGSITMPKGGVVRIGPTGVVRGGQDAEAVTIEADIIYVEGTVHGRLVAREGLELSPSATVKGQIVYHKEMHIQNLAKVRASIAHAGTEE